MLSKGWIAEEDLVSGKGSKEVEGAPGRVSLADCLMEEASNCQFEGKRKGAICKSSEGAVGGRKGFEKGDGGSSPVRDGRTEEEGGDVESWRYNCLAKFCHCLGMPTEGFEGEILKVLNRMKERRERFERGIEVNRSVLDEASNPFVEFGGDGGGQIFSLLSFQELWGRFLLDFHRSRRPSVLAMRRFSEVIEDLELRDLPLQGGLFTWSGGSNDQLSWNKEVFGKVETKKQSAWNLVDFWDKEENAHSLTMEEEEARKEARETYKKWFTEEIEIKEEVSRAFQGLLSDPDGWKPNIDGLNFERLDVEGLEKPFSKEEVEVMNFFRQFHESGSFVRSLNATFLVLIPKKGEAEDLKDFRPISLVGGLYKWLTKVLANRLKVVLAKVISTSQNAFVEGWQIMDAVLIANEAIYSILKSNKGAILCKLDIEKAYDHVDWSFLLVVLEKMGAQGFKAKRPLSPYLFIIVMEAFSCLLKRAIYGGFLSSCSVRGRRGLRVNLEMIPFGRVENVEELVEEFDNRMVRMRLEQIQRDFLWGGGALEQKPHLVRFWKDKWCGTTPLCESFPCLFALATSKEACVNGVWTTAGGKGGGEGEVGALVSLDLSMIGRWKRWKGCFVAWIEEGYVGRWMDSKDGVFFFAWEASWGRVLTLDRLQKRGWALANRCFLCQMVEESIDHLLLHCEKTREVWMLFLSLFGVSWVFPYSVKETLLGWRGSFVGKKRKAVWQVGSSCVFGSFGRQGIKLPLKIVYCPSKG
ncbi:Transposon TX1 uncharacterized 149 kDa protein [Vitis vinifera]|uniref:Transposon TX1 uncharacterized 149 kDa protein n=1 Tax=Vitis vinifera TaxID=29760 RepID=A0A438E205_VITVI|nr:Transposon TX1 uncharacterized 149 kDa protein [Vitis vinifera]